MAKTKQESVHGFPNPLAPQEEKKSEKYGLNYARAIWDEAQGKSRQFYRYRQRVVELRNYAVDTMTIEKFKDKYAIDNGNTSYLNLNFNFGTVIPNLVNISSNKLIDRGYEITLDSIDKDSSDEWDKEIKKRIGEMKIRKAAIDMAERGEVNSTVEDLLRDTEGAATSEDEVIFDMQMNFKTEAEESYEAALDFVWMNNQIKEVEKVIARDLHVLQRAGTMTYLDGNGDVRIDWVDQKNFVSGYCTHPDYSDCRYLGVVREMKLSEVKEMAGDKFTDEQYYEMALKWSPELGNDRFTLGSYTNGNWVFSEYSDFKVLVLFFQYKGVDREVYRKKVSKGTAYYDKVPDTYEEYYEDKNGERINKKGVVGIETKDVVNIYQGWYVTDTDYIFDYELKPNMTRAVEGGTYSTDTDFDIVEYAPQMQDMETKGMVERMMPHVEEMIIVNLKIQHLIAKSRPDGVAIDVAALQGISQGIGGKFVTMDMMNQVYDQVGNYYYNSMRADGSPAIAANTKPIERLDNGVARGLVDLIGYQNHLLTQIYQITGLNPAVDGTMPSKGTLVGTIQAQEMSYNSAVKHLFDAYVNIMQRTAKRAILLIQNQMDMGVKVRGYKRGIGGARTMVIEQTKKIKMSELGIEVNFKPTAGDKQEVRDYLLKAVDRDQISTGDAMRAEQILDQSPKEAAEFITRKVDAYAKMKSDRVMQEAQAAAESAQAAAQAKAQAEMQSTQAKTQGSLAEIEAQKQADIEKMMIEHKLLLERAAAATQDKLELIEKSAEMDNEPKEQSSSGSSEGFKVADAARKLRENTSVSKQSIGVSKPRVGVKPSDDVQQGITAAIN